MNVPSCDLFLLLLTLISIDIWQKNRVDRSHVREINIHVLLTADEKYVLTEHSSKLF